MHDTLFEEGKERTRLLGRKTIRHTGGRENSLESLILEENQSLDSGAVFLKLGGGGENMERGERKSGKKNGRRHGRDKGSGQVRRR